MLSQQLAHIENIASKDFLEGIQKMEFSLTYIPSAKETSKKLYNHVGWKLVDAENAYLPGDLWFGHLMKKEFPVTNYIRPMKEINFTPFPDLFHEYFGHMPAMFLQEVADLEYKFAELFFAVPEHQREQVFTLSWYTIEYALFLENNNIKAFGAGIMSSPGDLERVSRPEKDWDFVVEEGTLENILPILPSPHAPHKKLFVFHGLQHFHQLIDEYMKDFEKYEHLCTGDEMTKMIHEIAC